MDGCEKRGLARWCRNAKLQHHAFLEDVELSTPRRLNREVNP
jgi:hypothetical protein